MHTEMSKQELSELMLFFSNLTIPFIWQYNSIVYDIIITHSKYFIVPDYSTFVHLVELNGNLCYC